MKRCSLCGGKLDRENRCTLCGLDNTKNDSMYKHLVNRNDCEDAPLTHVHEEPKREVRKPYVNKPTSTYSGAKYSGKRVVKKVPSKNSKGVLATVGTIISCIIIIIGTISNFIDDRSEDYEVNYEEEMLQSTEDYEDRYSQVQMEMPVTGEVYETTLDAGIYVVGGHIPQGTYEVTIVEGDYGSISVDDSYNWIYFDVDLEYWGNAYEADVRLYEGAIFTVSSNIEVKLYTENAQPITLEGEVNPLTDIYEICDYAVAGKDFPAGVYDVHYKAEEGSWESMDCLISFEDEYGYHEVWVSLYFDHVYGDETYYNLVLPEGAEISMGNGEIVTLVPSENIYVTDYSEFYTTYY